MSKANKLASLAVDVNNLSDLADQVTDIENAIVRANTNAQVIEGIADDIEALEANTADIMNDFASISNVFNSGITYSTDGVNEYYDANSVTNTVATVDIIEMNIQNPQDGELLSYSTSANTWVNSPAPVIPETPAPVLSFRNKIINGDMRIAQRGMSSNSYATGLYLAVDRFGWFQENTDQLVVTGSQDTDAPNGFSNSYKISVNTAETNLDSDEIAGIYQSIEAQNLQNLNFGTSNALSLTLSFWVKSTEVGTYVALLYTDDQGRGITKNYTIEQANTWEFKTITYDGDTGGGIDNDNGNGLGVYWVLSSGSARGTVDGTNWRNYDANQFGYSHTADVLTNSAATWQITGVQLEEGLIATPFEHRPYDLELSLCQRYFEFIENSNNNAHYLFPTGSTINSQNLRILIPYKAQKRIEPVVSGYSIKTGIKYTGLYNVFMCEVPSGGNVTIGGPDITAYPKKDFCPVKFYISNSGLVSSAGSGIYLRGSADNNTTAGSAYVNNYANSCRIEFNSEL